MFQNSGQSSPDKIGKMLCRQERPDKAELRADLLDTMDTAPTGHVYTVCAHDRSWLLERSFDIKSRMEWSRGKRHQRQRTIRWLVLTQTRTLILLWLKLERRD